MFIYGQRDAHNNFGSGQNFLGVFVIGFSAAIFVTYEFDNPGEFFKRTPSISPILVPLVIPVGLSLVPYKRMKDDVSDIGYLNSDEYVEGFKKVKTAFLGTLSGVTTGLISYYALR